MENFHIIFNVAASRGFYLRKNWSKWLILVSISKEKHRIGISMSVSQVILILKVKKKIVFYSYYSCRFGRIKKGEILHEKR